LTEDEYFEVRVGKEGIETPGNKGWTKENEYVYAPGEAGSYRWEIAICRGNLETRVCEKQLAVSEFNEPINVFELRGDCPPQQPETIPIIIP
jgi:hypothetical protein